MSTTRVELGGSSGKTVEHEQSAARCLPYRASELYCEYRTGLLRGSQPGGSSGWALYGESGTGSRAAAQRLRVLSDANAYGTKLSLAFTNVNWGRSPCTLLFSNDCSFTHAPHSLGNPSRIEISDWHRLSSGTLFFLVLGQIHSCSRL